MIYNRCLLPISARVSLSSV